MQLRPIQVDEFRKAIEIKNESWKNDYKNVVPEEILKNLNVDEETAWLTQWITEESEDDIRIILGAIVDNQIIGFVVASRVEECDAEYDVEVNMLFVKDNYRNMGLGLKLLEAVSKFFIAKDFSSLILYNWRELRSNQFYLSIGGRVVKEQMQNCGGKKLATDIFAWQIEELLAILQTKLTKYPKLKDIEVHC